MRLIVIALSLALLAGVIAGQGPDTSSREQLPAAVSFEQLHRLGYNHITPSQYLNLVSAVRPRCGFSFLERTAEDYMKDDGWERTEVAGYFVPEDSTGRKGNPLLLMYRSGKSYLLEPPISGDPLEPGLYWCKGIGSAWHILLENADEDIYWVKYEQ